MDPNAPQPPPRPTWIKVSFAVVLAIVAVAVVIALAGGDHGPGRHSPGGGDGHAPVEHNP